MAENTSASPTNSTPNKQPNRILLFLIRIKTIIKNIVIKIWSIPRGYFDAFTAEKRQKRPEDEDHALYIKYRPYAESARITIQMLIGVALVIILLIQIIVLIFT